MRSMRPGIHLPGTIALALDNPIAKACSEISRAIGASTICDNDFGSGRSLAKVREKSPYQGRLIENRNNDRKLHCLLHWQTVSFSYEFSRQRFLPK